MSLVESLTADIFFSYCHFARYKTVIYIIPYMYVLQSKVKSNVI